MINQMVNPADDVCRSYIHATNLYEARLPLRALYAVEGPSRGFDGFDNVLEYSLGCSRGRFTVLRLGDTWRKEKVHAKSS